MESEIDKIAYLKELKVKYDPTNQNDITQLISILTILGYPSTRRALLHMQCNRLGTLDLKQKKQKKQKHRLNKKQKQQHETEKNPFQSAIVSAGHLCEPRFKQDDKKKAKHCACCGLLRQTQKLSLLTHFDHIQHLGVATRLFFIAYQHVLVLMVSMFLIYALYAIISNVIACSYQQQNLRPEFQNSSYNELVSQWIFATSLHANLACSKGYSLSYEVQCWLGVVLMIIYFVIIAALRFRKILICARLKKSSKSIADLSILINNLPFGMSKNQLQKQLTEYQMKFDRDTDRAKKQIKIAKINRAAPYYLSLDTFKNKQIIEIEKEYDEARQKLVGLIMYRQKHSQFQMSENDRKQVYKNFQQVKLDRIDTYKRISLANVLKQNQNRIITSPAFVTFESSYNRQFLLETYKSSKKIFSSKQQFEFSIKSKNQKLTRKIKARFQAAPKPEEVIWTNLGQSKKSMIKKKIFIAAVNIFFLLLCFGVTFCLQLYDFNYAQEHDGDPSSLWITILVTLVIVAISYVISCTFMLIPRCFDPIDLKIEEYYSDA